MRIALMVVVLAGLSAGVAGLAANTDDAQAVGAGGQGLGALLPPQASTRLDALSALFDERAAFDLVVYMDQFWRNAGNAGFNASIDRIALRLEESGFARRGPDRVDGPTMWIDEYGKANGWDYTVGTLVLLGEGERPDTLLLSRDRQRVALCINSFSTPDGGVEAPVVDVGAGASPADYDGKDLKGAVVLGDASAGRLWQMAVAQRGAIGVISTTLPPYIRPEPADAETDQPRDQWDVLQWGSVPYDEQRRGFGFKATPRAASALRAKLAGGRGARVKVEISSSFSFGPARTLVAEIPGRSRPDERIVLAAHVQEPGANDNASGCATLMELARAIAVGVKAGRLPAPERTLTFLWLDEIRGSRQWLQDHPEEAKKVRYMFSLDMTGENTSKTGGTFLIEKAPDPTAVWDRPSDPHTEWGRGNVTADSLRGTLLNDVFLAFCQLRAARTGWVVRTNPYEGGSDHSVFLAAGVPAILAWHFPDRFYHSSLDRPAMTSPATMANVGISVAGTALFLASATEADGLSTVDLLAAAAAARLALERRQGTALLQADADRAAGEAREAAVTAAWLRWYGEAFDQAGTLPAGGPTDRLLAKVAAAKAALR